MDSLTQIVLGAAAGEVVLGKKIGNRAMVWGAVGGTIPDLDVLGGLFLSNIDNLAFHRGISHSITFSLVGAIAIGWIVHHLYKSPYHKWIAVLFKTAAVILTGFALDFVLKRFFPGNYVPIVIIMLGLIYLLYSSSKRKYFSNQWKAPDAGLRDWQHLFFWSLFTHPILDCFTMYGTQLFAPFSDYRVALSTISVADPMYTFPFIICLLIASRYSRLSNKRRFWNFMGIGLSSLYLLFTVFNKQRINNVFANALERQNIPAERFITNASILNNIVWSCAAETKEHFYLGQYSLFDEVDVKFTKLDKNHESLKGLDSDPTIKTLRWFCDDFFTVNMVGEKLQFNDLRFGTFTDGEIKPDDFIFKFLLTDQGEDGYHMEEARGGPPDGGGQELLKTLWKRIRGIKK